MTQNGFVNLDEDVTGVKALNAHNIIQHKETQPRSNYIDVIPEQSKEKQSFFSFGKKGNDEKHVLHMVSFLSLVSQPSLSNLHYIKQKGNNIDQKGNNIDLCRELEMNILYGIAAKLPLKSVCQVKMKSRCYSKLFIMQKINLNQKVVSRVA